MQAANSDPMYGESSEWVCPLRTASEAAGRRKSILKWNKTS